MRRFVVSDDVAATNRVWLVRDSVDAAYVAAAVYSALLRARGHTLGLVIASTLQRRIVQNRALDYDFVAALRSYPTVFAVDTDGLFAVTLVADTAACTPPPPPTPSSSCPSSLQALAGMVYEVVSGSGRDSASEDAVWECISAAEDGLGREDFVVKTGKDAVLAVFADVICAEKALGRASLRRLAERGLSLVPVESRRASKAAKDFARTACGRAARPAVVVPREGAGERPGEFEIRCSQTEEDAEVWYTVDGPAPDKWMGVGRRYEGGPVKVERESGAGRADPDAAAVVRARAYKRFAGESEVATEPVRLAPKALDPSEVDPFVIKYSDIILQPTYPSVNKHKYTHKNSIRVSNCRFL